ncbi:hypothetical protein H4582DRAFT_1966508 [Lactarius indigo]|nr:hypothetical protein H4582DRAFT_1966508 [Lactarius indigo]
MSSHGSDISSLSNDSLSDTTSNGSCEDLEVEITTQILCKRREEVQIQGKSYGRAITINMLPDNVLLDIFDSYRKDQDPDSFPFTVWAWHELAQVCRRWRQIIFGSPRRLDLHIFCTNGTPVRENLDIWPPFPIAIQYFQVGRNTLTPYDEDSLFAVLERHDQIRHVNLSLTGPRLTEVVAAMQVPFPALTHLTLRCRDERPAPLRIGFLGGSAPCLQYMHLEGIPFPALPSLLSSTSDLVNLSLDDITGTAYISPEVMATCLAALPRLKSLFIGCQETISYSDQIRSPPVMRTVVPSLISLEFHGATEYLENLVARIDGPQLNQIHIKHVEPRLDFQVARLFEFLDRSEDPEMTLLRHAYVNFSYRWVTFGMYARPESHPEWGRVSALIYCQGIESQVSRIAQVFSQPSAMLSGVVHLKLSRPRAKADIRANEWQYLLRQFSAVRTLRVCRGFAEHVALALEDVTAEMVPEVLPVVDLIYLGGQPVSSVEKFLAARRLSGHPVTIVDTEAEFDERVKSYDSE